MPIRRPCPRCGRLLERGERCPMCPEPKRAVDRRPVKAGHGQRYNHEWRKRSVAMRSQWVRMNGWVCPGWRIPQHPSRDLVVDHDVGVLCRGCNAIKAATHDKDRARRTTQGEGGGHST